VTLRDDGLGPDQAAGDGNYSGEWSPPGAGNFTLTFPDGSVLTVMAASLGASPSSVMPGATITASWAAIGVPSASDWIGIYVPGAPHGPNQPSLAWRYTTGTASGSVPVTIPATLAPGTYELRLFSNNGYTRLAVSNSFTVTGCTGSLSASPASAPAGGSVTGTWSGICAPAGADWIGLYLPGAPNQPSLAWRYTTGTASGSVPFTIPATLTPGTYELRLFSNNGYTRLGTSGTFAVTSP